MKNFLVAKSLAVVAAFLISDACQKSDELATTQKPVSILEMADSELNNDKTVSGDYQVRDGMLYFKNAKTFVQLEQKLNKLSPEKRIEFTRLLGFTSVADTKATADQQLEAAQTKEQFQQIVTKYQDILQLKGDHIEGNYKEGQAYLINRKGMVSIGGAIHVFTKEAQVITGSRIEEAEQAIKNPKASTLKAVGFQTLGGSPNAKLSASCSSIDRTAESTGNRRAQIRTYIDVEYFCLSGDCQSGQATYQVQQYAYTVGTPTKKNFFGSWVNYSTGNTLSTRYTLSFSSLATQYFTQNYSADYTYSNDWSDISYKQIVAAATIFSSAQGPAYATWTNTFTDGSPLGYYTSGGVPSGVQQACP